MTDKSAGPFTVNAEDEGNATVRDQTGEPFAWIIAAECRGGDKAAAKARATRIAESLNRTEGHPTEFTRTPEDCRMVAKIAAAFGGAVGFLLAFLLVAKGIM